MPLKGDKLLVFLPIHPPPGWLDKVNQHFPDLEVRWELARVEKTGLSSVDDLPRDVLAGVTMLCLYPPPSPETMRGVRFVQLASAGSDLWAREPSYLDPEVRFCSASGVHPPQIAEWVIGQWISHVHAFRKYDRDMGTQVWDPRRDMNRFGTDSVGRRMGILGYGAIGRNCARLAQAMGMEVYAYTHTPRPTPASRVDTTTYCVPGTGDPEGLIPTRWFSGSVDAFLAEPLDVVVVATALTEGTRGLLGRRQFAILGEKESKVFLCNVARGPIVDTDALVEALERGLLAGAALDVTDPEPLPEGHALWKAPNVSITPHVAWQSTNVMYRVVDVLYNNLLRLDSGERLLNLIKK